MSVAAATDTQHTGSWLDLPGRSLVVMCGKFFLHVLCNSFAEPSKVQMECTQATWNQNQSDLYKNMCQMILIFSLASCWIMCMLSCKPLQYVCVCVCEFLIRLHPDRNTSIKLLWKVIFFIFLFTMEWLFKCFALKD